MLITVRLFGSLAPKGQGGRQLDLPDGAVVSDAVARLELPPGAEVMFLLGGGPAGPDSALTDGAVLDLLPIVDGG